MRKILSKIPAENHTSTAIFPSRKESGCETFGNTYLISVPLILEALRLNTETLPVLPRIYPVGVFERKAALGVFRAVVVRLVLRHGFPLHALPSEHTG